MFVLQEIKSSNANAQEADAVGEGEEHGLRPLAVSGADFEDISFGGRPTAPHSLPAAQSKPQYVVLKYYFAISPLETS